MKIMVCVDDAGGMLFNKRRVSRDRTLCERAAVIAGDAPLRMNAYSAALFGDLPGVLVDDRFLENAGTGDFCFVENTAIPASLLPKIEEWYVFRWNRRYPADTFLKPTPEEAGFTRVHTEDFPGNSHELITLDIYRR